MLVIGPLVWSIKLFNDLLRQYLFHVAHEYDVVFAMEVYPTTIAVL